MYSYIKYTNIGSYSTAIANGMKKVKEYPDEKNIVLYVCKNRSNKTGPWWFLGDLEIHGICKEEKCTRKQKLIKSKND